MIELRHESSSIKKKFSKITILSEPLKSLGRCLLFYKDVFKVYRRDLSSIAREYVQGLMACEKGQANMERMEEEVDAGEYRRYQHFISNSKWDFKELIARISLDTLQTLVAYKKKSGVATGYIIDESSHLKKGKK